MTSNGEFVYDGLIETSISLLNSKKSFEVKDKDGQVVHNGDVATFSTDVYPQYPVDSAIQVIVPKEFSSSDYRINIIVKDSFNNEISSYIVNI